MEPKTSHCPGGGTVPGANRFPLRTRKCEGILGSWGFLLGCRDSRVEFCGETLSGPAAFPIGFRVCPRTEPVVRSLPVWCQKTDDTAKSEIWRLKILCRNPTSAPTYATTPSSRRTVLASGQFGSAPLRAMTLDCGTLFQ